MAKWKRVEPWHAKRGQPLLEHLFQRLGVGEGRASTLVPLTADEVAHHDRPHACELAGLGELYEHALQVMRAAAYLLEREDGPVQVKLPGSAHCLEQVGPTAADQATGRLSRR